MTNWYTGVKKRSWYNRIGDGFWGILFGLFLVTAASSLLFWMEGRSARKYMTLKEGAGAVIPLAADDTDTAGKEGQLVHITGLADTEQILTDPKFGISIRALKLRRSVTIYQWEETTHQHDNEDDTYSYARVWSTSLIDSREFAYKNGHSNSLEKMAFKTRNATAMIISVGNFRLYHAQKDKLDTYQLIAPPENNQLPVTLENKVRKKGNDLYLSANPDTLKIGDLRIRFSVIYPMNVSIIAALRGSSFRPYHTRSGGTIDMLKPGIMDANAMIDKEEKYHRIVSWVVRSIAFLFIYLGLHTILTRLSVLGGTVPLIGKMVGAGVTIIAVLLTAALSMGITGIAWLSYRPLVGQTLLAAGAGVLWLAVNRLRRITLSN